MSALRPPRDDPGTTMAPCPACGASFTPVGRQVYCSSVCRKRAFRRRSTGPRPVVAVGTRRDHTVYACPDCGQRRLGEQYCPDCNTFATSAGLGGACPCCGEPVTLADLELTEPSEP